MFKSDWAALVLLSFVSIGFLVVTPVSGTDGPEDQTEVANEGAAEGTLTTPPRVILKSQKAPLYPPAAEAARFEGKVYLELTVKADGSVGDVRVVECTHPRVGFEEASVKAVEQWQFEPAILDGEPVDYVMQFNLNFRSSGSGQGPNAYVSFGSGSSEDDKPTWRDRERRTPQDDTRQKSATTQQRRPGGPGTR